MKSEQSSQIVLRTVMGKQYKVQLTPTLTFGQVKQIIFKQTGIPVNKQIIIANMTIVKDDTILVQFYADNTFILAQRDNADENDSTATSSSNSTNSQKDKKQEVYQNKMMEDHTGAHGSNLASCCGMCQSCLYSVLQGFMRIKSQKVELSPYLNEQDQEKYRQFLCGFVDKSVVDDLVDMGASREEAIRACRAELNDKSSAWNFVEHVLSGHKLVGKCCKQYPQRDPEEEQMYILKYFKKVMKENILFADTKLLILKIASEKEYDSRTFDIIVRNGLFVQKLMTKYIYFIYSQVLCRACKRRYDLT